MARAVKKILNIFLRKSESKHSRKINDLIKNATFKNEENFDTAIIAEIRKAKTKDKLKYNRMLESLNLYFYHLRRVSRIKIDKEVNYAPIKLYTDFFLSDATFLTETFEHKNLQRPVCALIIANLNTHSMIAGNMLLEKYDYIFDEVYRPLVYQRILRQFCGTLSMDKYILPLFRNMNETLELLGDNPQNKLKYLNRMLALAYDLDIFKDSIQKHVRESIEYTRGLRTNPIINLYRTCLVYNICIDIVGEWMNSLSDTDIQDESIKKLIYFYEKRKEGIRLIERYNSHDTSERAEDNYRNILKNISNKCYSRSRLLHDMRDEFKTLTEKFSYSSEVHSMIKQTKRLDSLTAHIRAFEFWSEFETNLNKIDLKKENNPVLMFVNDYSLVNGALALPFLLAGKKRGFTVIPSSPRTFTCCSTGDEELDELTATFLGGIDLRYETTGEVDDYEIDIPNKRIMVQGLNIYQPIFEFVSRYQFTYFYKYQTDAWARSRTKYLIRVFNRLFNYIEDIDVWSKKTGRKVYFISNAPHIHNAAAYRIYCEEKKDVSDRMNFICVSTGYDNYFKNVGDAESETLAALNLTKNVYSRNSFLGTRETFENYYEKHKSEIAQIKESTKKYLSMNRGDETENNGEKNRIKKIISQYKNEGKTIALLNGKVIFDLGVKFTKGVVHEDMSEWITHAVEFAKKHPTEMLLIIKPHPHEYREDLTLTSEKTDDLRSLIKTDLPENCIFLDNNMFKNQELIPFIDIGLVWNGTSILEFEAQGLKTLVGDIWGHYDYPIGLIKPKNLEEYENYLLNPDTMIENSDIEDKAVMFLAFMGSKDVRMMNKYTKTASLNFNQFDSQICSDEIQEFIFRGDDILESWFEKIL